MENEAMIVIQNLSKKFDNTFVVKDSNMTVPKGCVYGFLGANGAGKTTIFKMLTGLISPTSGTVEVLGDDVTKDREKVLRSIGSLIEAPIFYEHLSAAENLTLHLAYMGTEGFGAEAALDMVGLNDTGSKPVSKFSLGMRQRLGIARAFIHKPKILILDEPINGLDPMGIRDIRNLFLTLTQKHDMTILLSSHILSEIEHIADLVGVIVNGTVVQEISLDQIKQQSDIRLEEYFFNVMSGGTIS
ncbi:ABC transporter ATP-binding protein [Konateibacter massiliensis]|uniref:ABC transporter ATP-binding protein n=1 Tax=Konateibacter massiliensis TaxID=2002841 RepID=UPI000C147722|nr:ATP-binding cassette domain-containing protein [Konateibacter massiliensis]